MKANRPNYPVLKPSPRRSRLIGSSFHQSRSTAKRDLGQKHRLLCKPEVAQRRKTGTASAWRQKTSRHKFTPLKIYSRLWGKRCCGGHLCLLISHTRTTELLFAKCYEDILLQWTSMIISMEEKHTSSLGLSHSSLRYLSTRHTDSLPVTDKQRDQPQHHKTPHTRYPQ